MGITRAVIGITRALMGISGHKNWALLGHYWALVGIDAYNFDQRFTPRVTFIRVPK